MKVLLRNISTSIQKMKEEHLKSPISDEQTQAIYHKEEGNMCLQQGLIDEAIMHYTKSLVSFVNIFDVFIPEFKSNQLHSVHKPFHGLQKTQRIPADARGCENGSFFQF